MILPKNSKIVLFKSKKDSYKFRSEILKKHGYIPAIFFNGKNYYSIVSK